MENGDPQKLLVMAARHLYRLGLTPGSGGNLSLAHKGTVLITPKGISFRELRKDLISLIDLEGNHLSGGRPSSEYRMHLEILRSDPEIKSVCHAHGCFTIAFSVLAMEGDLLPVVTPGMALLEPVVVLPLLLPGSEELAVAVKETIVGKKMKACVLKNHGVVCVGKDVWEAINICEEIEANLKIWFLTKNKTQTLPSSMVKLIQQNYGK